MNRIFPQPFISVAMVAAWLLAHGTLEPGHVLLALLLGLVIPWFTQGFWPEYPPIKSYPRLLSFFALVLWDIIIANIIVARLILGSRKRLRPQFMVVPIELTHPFAITMLANVISLTPGTVSSNLSGDRKSLLVHGLDVGDPAIAIAQMKARYEAPLKEIFPC